MITKDGYQIDCLAIEPDRVDLQNLAFPDYKCARCHTVGYFTDQVDACACPPTPSGLKPVFCGYQKRPFPDIVHALRFSALVYYSRLGYLSALEISPRFIVPFFQLSGKFIPSVFKASFAYTTAQKNQIVEIWDPLIDGFFESQCRHFIERYTDRNLVIFAKGASNDGRSHGAKR